MISVLLAEGQNLVRTGFRPLVEDESDIEVIGEAANGLEAIELAKELTPKVVVMDLAMPELDGFQAILEIRRQLPETAILALSMYSDSQYVRNAMRSGASGYLLKNAVDVDLVGAVRSVASGGIYMDPGLPPLPENEADDDPLNRLTQRELQVLQLIAQARSNKEIANILGLSVNTVNVHRANLMSALDLHSTAELVLFAVKRGLTALPK